MYQVIARKYRPQSFAELVNQDHVKATLANAISQNRIAHGYILSGQRGTGKTTVARIVARCLNCVNGPTSHPCGQCASCLETSGGNTVDVIEIDAASNRGINEMRELRENVRYRPARDRYKVFIIDEAHQITSEAFNALLKTLEEPPEWVVFILCTTEAHKIPATIASRCQHFSFRAVDFEELIERMRWICEQEGISADQEVLSVLAQAGEGSVRDSLSALDQAIACCGATLDLDEIRRMLGVFSLDALHQVTETLAESSLRGMLEITGDLERNGQNLQHFCRELSRYFRNLLVARLAGENTRLIAASPHERQRLSAIAAGFSEEDLTRYLQIALELYGDLQHSLQPRLHMELGLMRMVYAGRLLPIEEALAVARSGDEPPPPGGPGPDSRPLGAGAAPGGRPAPASRGPVPVPSRASTPHALAESPAPTAAAPAGPVSSSRPRAATVTGTATAPQRETAVAIAVAEPEVSFAAPAPGRIAEQAPAEPASAPEEAPKAEPSAGTSDWKWRVHEELSKLGMNFTADSVQHSRVEESSGELRFYTPKEHTFGFDAGDLGIALKSLGAGHLKPRIIATSEAATNSAAPEGQPKTDALTERALADPGIQLYRDLFPGQIRMVRDLRD